MAKVYAGTVGWGVWSSDDLGETWDFAFRGVNAECRIWSLSAHPAEPGVVWAGSDRGILRQDADGKAERVSSPADAMQVWAFAQAPDDPQTLLIGTNPGHVFRSDDGGAHWRELPIDLVEECLIGKPRITRIRFDPFDANAFWASAEIDAVHRTEDGGETWRRCEDGFKFPDIHDIAVIDDDGARKLLAATAVGLYRSTDDGRTWQWNRLDSPWQYTRGLKPRADLNGTVFLCNGDGPPGSRGRLLRSRDWGETWEDANLPEPTNSTPWNRRHQRRRPEPAVRLHEPGPDVPQHRRRRELGETAPRTRRNPHDAVAPVAGRRWLVAERAWCDCRRASVDGSGDGRAGHASRNSRSFTAGSRFRR